MSLFSIHGYQFSGHCHTQHYYPDFCPFVKLQKPATISSHRIVGWGQNHSRKQRGIPLLQLQQCRNPALAKAWPKSDRISCARFPLKAVCWEWSKHGLFSLRCISFALPMQRQSLPHWIVDTKFTFTVLMLKTNFFQSSPKDLHEKLVT